MTLGKEAALDRRRRLDVAACHEAHLGEVAKLQLLVHELVELVGKHLARHLRDQRRLVELHLLGLVLLHVAVLLDDPPVGGLAERVVLDKVHVEDVTLAALADEARRDPEVEEARVLELGVELARRRRQVHCGFRKHLVALGERRALLDHRDGTQLACVRLERRDGRQARCGDLGREESHHAPQLLPALAVAFDELTSLPRQRGGHGAQQREGPQLAEAKEFDADARVLRQ